MCKNRSIIFVISVICLLALLATCLFACNRKIDTEEDPSAGRVMPVSTAVELVHTALLASDGTKGSNRFSMSFDGSYQSGETTYTFTFDGRFDVTRANREKDEESVFAFTLKRGAEELLLLYYAEGKMYLEFSPYAHLARIADRNLSETVYEIYGQKNEGGVIDTMLEGLPTLAKRVFDDCRYFSDGGVDRYVFTLSVERLFASLSTYVESWDAGFTYAEFLSAIDLDEEEIKALAEEEAKTTVECRIQGGALLSAKVETEGKRSVKLNSFRLQSGDAEITLPDKLSSFTEYDPLNFAMAGKLRLNTALKSHTRQENYGISVNRVSREMTYSFDYELHTHYVEGVGLEGDLRLTETTVNGDRGKSAYFALRGDTLYVDLTAYGIARFKMKTADLRGDLTDTGFTDVGAYEFKDKIRLLILLALARTEEGDTVTYTLSQEICSLLTKKIGFEGIIGVQGAEISWTKASQGLRDLTLSIESDALTVNLSAESFTGRTEPLAAVSDEGSYTDLSTRETTSIRSTGVLLDHTDSGEYLSAMISSLAGQSVSLPAKDPVRYDLRLLYDKDGKMTQAFLLLDDENTGRKIADLYYTDSTKGYFYLVYPKDGGVRESVRLPITDMKAFNASLNAVTPTRSRTIYIETSETQSETSTVQNIKLGMQPGFAEWLEEKLQILYPDLSFALLLQIDCARYELEISGFGNATHKLSARVRFDEDNDITVRDLTFSVRFDQEAAEPLFTLPDFETSVHLLSENTMPDHVTVRFGDVLFDDVSLVDPDTEEKLWTYVGQPRNLTRAGDVVVVTAKVDLFGSELAKELRVDCSPVRSVSLENSTFAGHALRDPAGEISGFTFERYGNDTLTYVLASFDTLIVNDTLRKDVTWAVNEDTTVLDLTQNGVKPLVGTFFGGAPIEIKKGSAVVSYPVEVVGESVNRRVDAYAYDPSTDEPVEILFEAYDRRDPFSASSYPRTVMVTLQDGSKLKVSNIRWSFDGIAAIKTAFEVDNVERNHLYEHQGQSSITVYVVDFTGHTDSASVKVSFRRKVVEKADVRFTRPLAQGVSYEEGTFFFDPFVVQSLTEGNKHSILPTTFSLDGETGEYPVNWVIESFSVVQNASGKSGTLTLKFGDDISGYQEIDFDYAFLVKDVIKTALVAADGTVLWEKEKPTDPDLFLYEIGSTDERVNAFDKDNYQTPVLLRVWCDGASSYEDLEIVWDVTFDENDAAREDAVRTLHFAVGSERLTVRITFGQTYVQKASATQDTLHTSSGEIVTHKTIGGNILVLCYSVADALRGEGLAYWDEGSYPSELALDCLFGGTPLTINAIVESWDLSGLLAEIAEKDVITSGHRGTAVATVKGQKIAVTVEIAPAEGFYFNAGKSEVKEVRLLSVEGGTYKITDVLDSSVYGTSIWVEGVSYLTGASVSGVWEVPLSNAWDTSAVSNLLSKDEDAALYEAAGTASVKVTVGYGSHSYAVQTTVDLTAKLVASTFENVEPKGIPLAARLKQTGGTTILAITPGEKGSVGSESNKFSYDFSLSFNRYYVNSSDADCYPTHIQVTLNGRSCLLPIDRWDLSQVNDESLKIAQGDTTYTAYRAYAFIKLGSVGEKKIPVEVRVLTCEIDEILVNGSTQDTINIDGYRSHPFGENDTETQVCLEVSVRFYGDNNYYPLNLVFDKSKLGTAISFNGIGRTIENVQVKVGNEAGGYVDRVYSISFASKIVKRIEMTTPSGDVLLYNSYIAGNEKIEELYDVETYGVLTGDRLTDKIKVTFEDNEQITVEKLSETSEDAGIVFKWEGTRGVAFWNPTLVKDFAYSTEADRQYIIFGADKQTLREKDKVLFYKSAKDVTFLDDTHTLTFAEDEAWEVPYRDNHDGEGYITIGWLFDACTPLIRTDSIPRARHTITIVVKSAGEETVYENVTKYRSLRLTTGTYYLHVAVGDEDPGYSGYSEMPIRIVAKDISDYVVLYINSLLIRDESTNLPKDNHTVPYIGSAYAVSAGISGYSVDSVALLVKRTDTEEDADESCLVSAVCYNEVNEVSYYRFTVVVAADMISKNYTVNKTLRVKIAEKTEFEDTFTELTWNALLGKFNVTVKVKVKDEVTGEIVEKTLSQVALTDDLTNGYQIGYYIEVAGIRQTVLEKDLQANKNYGYTIEVKVPNYVSWTKEGSKTSA